MTALGILSKDETFDPGVNLDSCGEDSDCETLNNEKSHSLVGCSGGPDIVLNDFSSESCQCTGTKCLCDDQTLSMFSGGPNADPGPRKCQGKPSYCSSKCTGDKTRNFYSTGQHEFECGKAHDGLCKNCAKGCRTCPVCGRQYARNKQK